MKILLVEDDRVGRMALAEILRLSGYTIVCAEDGLEAIEEMKRVKFDLILLDLMMPRMNGIEFLKELRSRHDQEIPKVIVMTAGSDLEMISEAERLGAVACMIKARYTIPELLLSIRNHIPPDEGMHSPVNGV